MTAEAAATISQDRVRVWINRNKRENIACTPMVMLSVEHGGPNNGRLVVNAIEEKELTDPQLLLLLEGATAMLRARMAAKTN